MTNNKSLVWHNNKMIFIDCLERPFVKAQTRNIRKWLNLMNNFDLSASFLGPINKSVSDAKMELILRN